MSKELVLYFSVYGTAKNVAEEIAKQMGADLREIVPAVPYDGNRDHYPALLRVAQKEHDTDARPGIKEELPIAEYDRIYLGYPMWCYTFPMIIYTLFDQYDFSGKTIIPFNTHMGVPLAGAADSESVKEEEHGTGNQTVPAVLGCPGKI